LRLLRAAAWLLVLAPGTVFFSACGDRQEAAVVELFEDDYGFSVDEFLRAAEEGNVGAVRRFIAGGMNPAAADIASVQALHVACAAGKNKVVEELLKVGVDPLVARGDDRTPLMLAAESGDGHSVKLLLDAGAEPLRRDASGWTAIGLAAYGGFAQAVEVLAPLSRPLLDDALLLAAIGGHVAAIDPLVSSDAKIDARSADEKTPLMLAAARGHGNTVEYLLHHGANNYATDRDENTAAQMAEAGGHDEIVNLLESAHRKESKLGADSETFDQNMVAEEVLYSQEARRLDGERLIGSDGSPSALARNMQMSGYQERQLPIHLQGVTTDPGGGRLAQIKLLFGGHELVDVRAGELVPLTQLKVEAIEEDWISGKEGQGTSLRVLSLVVRDLGSGERIAITPEDPGISAKSHALVRYQITGQVYEARRGDVFAIGENSFRVFDISPRQVFFENVADGAVLSVKRSR